MARLVYSAICSLDEYVEDADGGFGWAEPDDELLAFVNGRERPIGTYLYGRRMYQTMLFWETADPAEHPPVVQDFIGIWRSADKVVYSTTLTSPSSARTTVETSFDADAVRRLKASADRDISVGGADLAGQALRAGLVDQVDLILAPVVVGGGRPALPHDVRLALTLRETNHFAGGFVHLSYDVRT